MAESPAPSPAPAVEALAPQFVGLSVADLDASVRWYQDTLGLRLAEKIQAPDGSARVAILRGEGLVMELLQHRQSVPVKKLAPDLAGAYLVQGIFKVGFHVWDLDGVVARLRKRGVRFVTDVVDDQAHGQRFVLVEDNGGNTLQIFAPPKPSR